MQYSDILKALCFEYDELRVKKIKRLSISLITSCPEEIRERLAVDLIKYVSETYWKWSPLTLRDKLTRERIKEWGLHNVFVLIEFPIELDKNNDLFYIACLAYPNVAMLSEYDRYATIYKRILTGQLGRFPKNFFEGPEARSKVCACVKYAIENYHPFKNIEEAYKFFGTNECLRFLRDVKLTPIINGIFDCNVEIIHEILLPNERNNFLFLYYRTKQLAQKNKGRRGGKTREE